MWIDHTWKSGIECEVELSVEKGSESHGARDVTQVRLTLSSPLSPLFVEALPPRHDVCRGDTECASPVPYRTDADAHNSFCDEVGNWNREGARRGEARRTQSIEPSRSLTVNIEQRPKKAMLILQAGHKSTARINGDAASAERSEIAVVVVVLRCVCPHS